MAPNVFYFVSGECLADTDRCTNGLTVMFDIKMTPQLIQKNLDAGNTHQYVISTGGQRKDSKGFAVLYQKDATYEGFKLQLQTGTADYVVPITSLPEVWFSFAFTFKKGKNQYYFSVSIVCAETQHHL